MIPTSFLHSDEPRIRRALLLLAGSVLCLSHCTQSAMADVRPATHAPAVVPVTEILPLTNGVHDSYNLTLKQLGQRDPMNLRGVDSTDSVNFDIRTDEVVTGAQLVLQFSYSPALLTDLSQLNVLINDEVAASLPLPKESAGMEQQRVVEIPARFITEFNRLSLQFIGHYTMQCEDPLHSSLWAKISNESQLNIQVSPIALKDDLGILPLPFFDRRDARQLHLPFVFVGTPNNAMLEAAGIVSSWFGALASYRGASFPASDGKLPAKGNAVVLINGRDAVQLPGFKIPAAAGPTVTMVANPNDPYGKLLIVTGRDDAELKRAASAVALGSKALSGNSVVINSLEPVAPRHPYDAPNWLPMDRKVKIGELIETRQLSISGYDAGNVDVPLRMPPDLFDWREDGIPLDIKYRYTPQLFSTNSSLIVSLNDSLVKSMQLPSIPNLNGGQNLLDMLKKDESLPQESSMLLPLSSSAFESQLQFRFMYDYVKQGECRDVIVENMRGLIDPDSTMDLRNYNHYIAMPNLGVFNDSGFPFTRMADLSQTGVVMSDSMGSDEWGAYLTVLGRFGESTGYPAIGVSVVQSRDVQSVADKDLLIFSTGVDQPLLKQWADTLPASTEGNRHLFDLGDLALHIHNWFRPDPQATLRKTRTALNYSGTSSTFLASFESPLASGRSVVVIASGQPNGLTEATTAMIGGDEYEDSIQGSLAVVQGKQITTLNAEQTYFVGELRPLKQLQWWLSQHLGWMLFGAVLGFLLLTGLLFLGLRAQAKRRLA
ncbi:MAG: cellulose biosynthesis cyclic di-GMP-binding regulatory protein BcsB [Pseudomonas sp.]